MPEENKTFEEEFDAGCAHAWYYEGEKVVECLQSTKKIKALALKHIERARQEGRQEGKEKIIEAFKNWCKT